MKGGWHMMAVGGSRRSAYNSGLPMSRVVASSYVISGIFAGVAAVFYAARLGSPGADTGKGMEIIILTAAILGGIRLGRSEEHTSELQSLMRISYAVFCLKKKTQKNQNNIT